MQIDNMTADMVEPCRQRAFLDSSKITGRIRQELTKREAMSSHVCPCFVKFLLMQIPVWPGLYALTEQLHAAAPPHAWSGTCPNQA